MDTTISQLSPVNVTTEETPSQNDNIALSACAGVVMLCAVVGNIGVFAAIISSKSLRRINNVLITSLAVSDIMRAVVILPMFIGVQMYEGDNRTFCASYHAIKITLDTATLVHLVFVSLERSFIIYRPLAYYRVVNQRKMILCVLSLWFASTSYGLPQLAWVLIAPFDYFESCYVQTPLGFIIFDFILRFILPLLCIIGAYCRICHVAHGHIMRIQPMSSFTTMSQCTNPTSEDSLGTDSQPPEAPRDVELKSSEVESFSSESEDSDPYSCPSPDTWDNETEEYMYSLINGDSWLSRETFAQQDEVILQVEGYLKRSPSYKHLSMPQLCMETISRQDRSNSSPEFPSQPSHPSILRKPLELQTADHGYSRRRSVSFQIGSDDLNVRSKVTTGGEHSGSTRGGSTSPMSTTGQAVWTTQSSSAEHSTSTSTENSPLPSSSDLQKRFSRRRSSVTIQNVRATKMTFSVVLTFLVCYLPFEVCHFLYSVSPVSVTLTVVNVTVIISAASSLLNPLAYNYYSKEFRRAVKRAMSKTNVTEGTN